MNSSITCRVDLSKEPSLRRELARVGFTFEPIGYAFWRARDGETALTFYHSGKLLIQGHDTEEIINFLSGIGIIDSEGHPGISKWIGTDESGKGDYFGPLVIAGVLVNNDTKEELLRMGAKDSKKISSKTTISILANRIRRLCPHSLITVRPARHAPWQQDFQNTGQGHADNQQL